MLFSPKSKGFTLIELLVVIAVIGLLASIVLVSLTGVRKKARDAIRKQDLKTIQTALELYWASYERYPPEGHYCDSSVGAAGAPCPPSSPQDYWDTNSDLQDLVSEGILGTIPVDPINNSSYYYWYEPDSIAQGCQVNTCKWTLCAHLETTGAEYCLRSAEQGP